MAVNTSGCGLNQALARRSKSTPNGNKKDLMGILDSIKVRASPTKHGPSLSAMALTTSDRGARRSLHIE